MDRNKMTAEDTRIARVLGAQLMAAKDRAGLTFDDLAAMTGLSRPHVTRILYGTIDARIGDVRRLCEPLGLNGAEAVRAAMSPHAEEAATSR